MVATIRNLFVFCFFSFSAFNANAQQGNVWAFGYHLGLDFNFKPVKLISTGIFQNRGAPNDPAFSSSSISDCKGHLLFYSTGQYVFNRFDKIMPHGSMNNTGSKDIYIVNVPGDTARYFLVYWASYGLGYSIVNMNLDSGRGDVDTLNKDIWMPNSAGYPYTFTVIKNSNNKDYWIIDVVKKDTVYVYPLTSSGIGSPKKQPKTNFSIPYMMRGNHKGDKIIMTNVSFASNSYGAVQYNFNASYGTLSNPVAFFDVSPTTNNLGSKIILFQGEYSANDSMLYITAMEPNSANKNSNYESRIYQCEPYGSLNGTLNLVYKQENIQGGSMQLGPDNSIYFGFALDSFMSVVKYPEKKGLGCDPVGKFIDLRPGRLGNFLPNIYAPIRQLKWKTITSCGDSLHFFNLSDSSYFHSFRWYFGDGDSSSKYAPWHTYKKAGKYNVTLVGTNACGSKLYYSDSAVLHFPAHAGLALDSVYYTCGKANIAVHNIFKDTTQSFAWDVGDGSGWYAGDPKIKDSLHHVIMRNYYEGTGTYYLRQAVSTGYCEDTAGLAVKVRVEATPIASFSISSQSQCQPYRLTVNNTSKNSYTYLWSAAWAKGSLTDTSANALSLPLSSLDTGYHALTLMSSNHQDCHSTFTMPKAIYISPHPTPSFTDSQKVLCSSVNVGFKNNSLYANKYLWRFSPPSGGGGAGVDSTKSPMHQFSSSGTYNLQLIAYNNYCQDTAKQAISIYIPVLKSDFSADKPKGCPNLNVHFSNLTSYGNLAGFQNLRGLGVSYSWDFGDPASSKITDTAAQPTHIYANPGSYTVRLISTITTTGGALCQDTLIRKNYINILPFPKAALAVKDSTVLCHAFRYSFNNLSSKADSFSWNFGDGSALLIRHDTTQAGHIYKNSGAYIVSLVAGNGFCLDSSHIKTEMILRPAPIPAFVADSAIVCIGSRFRFKNTSSNTDSVIWDFGDGSKDTALNPIHYYAQKGIYNVSLIAKSKEGCIVSLVKSSYLQVADTFHADINPLSSSGCAPLTVQFRTSATQKDAALYYYWQFGDGGNSQDKDPAYIYQKKGVHSYVVKLLVSNSPLGVGGGCSDTASAIVNVKSLDPVLDTIIMRLATVDSDAYAHIYWQKHDLVTMYQLLRSEDGINYTPADTLGDTSFIDRKVDVHQKNYTYKVQGLDACGGLSAMSNPASTILLSGSSQNEDALANLSWNDYRLFRYGLKNYRLVKDQLIQSPVVNTAYTDNEFFSESAPEHDYQVIASENSADSLKSVSNILKIPLKARLWIPNAFTPDGNSRNDSFVVRATGLKSYHISIFNRWGERVYESDDISKPWHGIGEKIQQGIYLYIISGEAANGEAVKRKGTITVLK